MSRTSRWTAWVLWLAGACLPAGGCSLQVGPGTARAERGEVELLERLWSRPAARELLGAYGDPRRVTAEGAVGRNRERYSDAATQRDALWTLRLGVAAGREDAAALAVRALEYGLDHQREDGGFENALGVAPVEAVGGDAFFLQAVGQAHALLAQRGATELLARLDARRDDVARAARWLARNEEELVRQDGHAPNRLLFDSLALTLGGRAVGDEELERRGRAFLDRALATQREDGVLVEKGGHDSSYQAVCVLNLSLLWLHTEDVPTRARIRTALAEAAGWEKGRILEDGTVDVTGNTRTGLGQEEFFGKPKDVNYAEVALSLYYWSEIGDDAEAAELADRVVARLRAASKR